MDRSVGLRLVCYVDGANVYFRPRPFSLLEKTGALKAFGVQISRSKQPSSENRREKEVRKVRAVASGPTEDLRSTMALQLGSALFLGRSKYSLQRDSAHMRDTATASAQLGEITLH